MRNVVRRPAKPLTSLSSPSTHLRYLGGASGGAIAARLVTYSDPKNLKKAFGKYTEPKYASIKELQVRLVANNVQENEFLHCCDVD